ncbi:hypothetical protein B4098_0405 [Heyndrickxia coagulans]|uniref:Uncharacterized protein n=1 Tax=Heyndrickxia coagulans TaxID=1398 RepID=A0A150K0A8_HEYCO|nr:hypothetical protein B4098_0405 [Heyndrickxia coagulans]
MPRNRKIGKRAVFKFPRIPAPGFYCANLPGKRDGQGAENRPAFFVHPAVPFMKEFSL